VRTPSVASVLIALVLLGCTPAPTTVQPPTLTDAQASWCADNPAAVSQAVLALGLADDASPDVRNAIRALAEPTFLGGPGSPEETDAIWNDWQADHPTEFVTACLSAADQ